MASGLFARIRKLAFAQNSTKRHRQQRPVTVRLTLEALESRNLLSSGPGGGSTVLAPIAPNTSGSTPQGSTAPITSSPSPNQGYPLPPACGPASTGGPGPSPAPVLLPMQGSSLAVVGSLATLTSSGGSGPSQPTQQTSGGGSTIVVAATTTP